MIIVRPGGQLFSAAAAYPLASAFGLALYQVLTRAVAKHDDPRVTTFFGALIAFAAFSAALPGQFMLPRSGTDLAGFIIIGALAALGQLLASLAYRYAPTHVVAPLGYTSLIVAAVLGWWIFDNIPDGWSTAGMVIIALMGAFMVTRKVS